MTAPTVAETLEGAATLLSKPGAWVQRELGFDAQGDRIADASRIEAAVCFCIAGAIWRTSGVVRDVNDEIVWRAFDLVKAVTKTRLGVGPWNDTPGRTQSEVVAKLREAAALARERGI